MAPKRPPPIEQPPSASSSEGEEESEEEVSEEEHREDENRTNAQSDVEEEESEDEEEEEEEQVFKKSSGQKAGAKSPPSEDSDSEESDSEQTQPSPSASDFTVKPIVSKPMEDSPAKKPFNKPPPSGSKHIVSNQTDELTKPKKGSAKRTVESGQNGKDSQKKSKVSNGDEEDRAVEEKKTGAINRLWSEDDEIAILRGIIEYSKTGGDIHSDMAAFHESIKKSLHVDVSKSQLMDKIRRLKKKYQVNSGRGQKGEDPVFSKLHEHKAFELSKKIWGDGGSNAVDDGAKSSSKRAKTSVKNNDGALIAKDFALDVPVQEGLKGEEKDIELDQRDFWSMYPMLGASLEMEKCHLSLSEAGRNFIKENMSIIGDVKAKELEEKWKRLQADAAALFLKRLDLLSEQTKLFLDAVNSSRS
ncbi:STOREKEEPER protein-like [Diospyros lotus]|uniref:STOREKEEPER protein-like n=1 Tax=Diospyros lotus TaxID=55363 RepID=UPI00224D3A7D|nr:STOREKEEPER protein-like [Diospyros lotus]